ncbi:MAG: SDR family oxidoreductase, partial [Gammaproteobacteria bacterium]|nr:SDR family oxidoreductase [Gammaproteobacteria bacterium]
MRGHLLHPRKRCIECPRPARVVMSVNSRAADVIEVRHHVGGGFGDTLYRGHVADRAEGTGLATAAVVTDDVDEERVVEFAHLLDGGAQTADLRIGMRAVAPHMIRQHSGSIINNSSADGLHGANALSAYVASKFAVRGMTKVAALELGPHGVRVNSVHPGGINTPMANPQNLPSAQLDFAFKQFAAQRVGRPEEAAECFVFLASDESSYCMGSELAVDGGLTAGHY